MSKTWFYEVMGSPIGPISSADLKTCVLTRRILPETRIRLGTDGKWQTADKIKGLFDSVGDKPAEKKPAVAAVAKPSKGIAVAETSTVEIASVQVATVASMPVAKPVVAEDTSEITYHYPGEERAPVRITDAQGNEEYDFFRFVGFELAIGAPLHKALNEYCYANRVTMTQATKKALAQFLNRKDLIGEASAPVATVAEPEGIS